MSVWTEPEGCVDWRVMVVVVVEELGELTVVVAVLYDPVNVVVPPVTTPE